MDFMTSIKTCISKYADFSGRAIRPEFWWFVLFTFVGSMVLGVVDGALFGFGAVGIFGLIFQLALLVPSLAVGARRLHDIGHSGWLQLLALIPVLGWIALIYLYAQPGNSKGDKYG